LLSFDTITIYVDGTGKFAALWHKKGQLFFYMAFAYCVNVCMVNNDNNNNNNHDNVYGAVIMT